MSCFIPPFSVSYSLMTTVFCFIFLPYRFLIFLIYIISSFGIVFSFLFLEFFECLVAGKFSAERGIESDQKIHQKAAASVSENPASPQDPVFPRAAACKPVRETRPSPDLHGMTWEALVSAHGKHMVTDTCAIVRLSRTLRTRRAGEGRPVRFLRGRRLTLS